MTGPTPNYDFYLAERPCEVAAYRRGSVNGEPAGDIEVVTRDGAFVRLEYTRVAGPQRVCVSTGAILADSLRVRIDDVTGSAGIDFVRVAAPPSLIDSSTSFAGPIPYADAVRIVRDALPDAPAPPGYILMRHAWVPGETYLLGRELYERAAAMVASPSWSLHAPSPARPEPPPPVALPIQTRRLPERRSRGITLLTDAADVVASIPPR